MAIVIEEEKNGVNIMKIVIWLMPIAIFGAVVYYLFFSKPELVDIAAPPTFQNIDFLAEISINPEEVVNNPAFRSLRQNASTPLPGNAGRSNPFIAP